MKIQWLGHACFKITENGYSIVIDPYNSDYTEGYPKLDITADKLLISHENYGHNYRDGVKLSGRDENESPFTIKSFEVDHDSVNGIMRGKCLVHIIEANGVRVAHMSDIGTQLNGGQISQLMDLDAIMVTAGSLTGLPSEAVQRMYEELFPKVLIPMHYRDGVRGPRRLETINDLINKFETPDFAKFYNTDTIEITADIEPQIAVLKYMGGEGKSNFPKNYTGGNESAKKAEKDRTEKPGLLRGIIAKIKK